MIECVAMNLILGLLCAAGIWESWRDRRPGRMWTCIVLLVICLIVVTACVHTKDWETQ